ncbi:MAG: 3-phosphoshikimate 1-carboxyvinyltransferase, partial [Armatimonadetes bacterium]|nr:3-phosphoshikimate 1-carboxyvinyltransferase [Armatimonadota bacterium]NIO97242.1 3-phosphoshikimate 1-carboxyvinyltransferase [Armatimonadota bacterium]
MGAEVDGQGERCLPPITIRGGDLTAIEYEMPVASAQVKSAVLLAGLRAKGQTRVKEPGLSRDHTERMLKMFGADLEYGPGFAAINGGQALQARSVCVPGDFSAAAFLMVGAALVSESEIEIAEVGLNPTRTGLLDVLKEMGADVEVARSEPEGEVEGEPIGRVRVRGGGRLRGCKIGKELIPRLIDELPVLCVAAA